MQLSSYRRGSFSRNAESLEHVGRTWEGLIRATGGALVVEKSSWWLINFRWNEDGSVRYITKADHPGNLRIKDADGITKCIPRLDPSEAFGTYLPCTRWKWKGTDGGYGESSKNKGC
jgi:hypothetical protein